MISCVQGAFLLDVVQPQLLCVRERAAAGFQKKNGNHAQVAQLAEHVLGKDEV